MGTARIRAARIPEAICSHCGINHLQSGPYGPSSAITVIRVKHGYGYQRLQVWATSISDVVNSMYFEYEEQGEFADTQD